MAINVLMFAVLALCLIVFVTMLTSLVILVPYVPTPKKVYAKMIELAELNGNEKIYDLGCGDARLLIETKKQHPNITAVGYELPIAVWLLARLRIFFSNADVTVHMRDFFGADLSDADVVFLYLVPEVMGRLEKKLQSELKPGTRIISHAFPLPNMKETHMERVPLPTWHFMRQKKYVGPRVFVYRW